ncbi:hypothetical protein LX81_01577 [Palleronia aestuarii]|uniref:Uncharacterized protein n=1 Tax=Palleronia aestuarii TaxID=568105 RepID=A0A2W7NFJ6_9RHOB|nr:hypothetical protein [Palleronia aestuarii]PZX16947.1 hypothetical protein LX81_01577 [Palleronia aestuarii]
MTYVMQLAAFLDVADEINRLLTAPRGAAGPATREESYDAFQEIAAIIGVRAYRDGLLHQEIVRVGDG